MAEMHYSEYLNKVRGCIMGLGDMSWIEPALRVVAKSGADFTAMQLADAYEKGGALTPHFLRNMDRGIFPPLAVFDDPEQGGAGRHGLRALWACVCPGDRLVRANMPGAMLRWTIRARRSRPRSSWPQQWRWPSSRTTRCSA